MLESKLWIWSKRCTETCPITLLHVLPTLIGRCIVTPKNYGIEQLNNMFMDLFPAPSPQCSKTYLSADYQAEDETDAQYPVELL